MNDFEVFAGSPFSSLFTHPANVKPNMWRIKGSGIQSVPKDSATINAVWGACRELGIEVTYKRSGSPGNCDSYTLESSFLDGGFRSETGNYWYQSRGAWVIGSKAVLLLALKIGLRVMPSWRRKYGLEDVTLEDLILELEASIKSKG